MNRFNAVLALFLCVLTAGTAAAFERPTMSAPASDGLYAVDLKDLEMDKAVSREIVATDGAIFRVTLVPPVGTDVNPRIFDSLRFEPIDRDVQPKSSPVHRDSAPLDVSGYTVLVDQLSKTQSTSCTGYRNSGYNYYLSGGAAAQYCPSGTPESLNASAYPKYGDVDVYVQSGSTTCSSSTVDGGYMDSAGCANSACYTTTRMCAKFVHYYTSSSTSTTYDWVVFQYLVNN